jgi:hypothetical protein
MVSQVSMKKKSELLPMKNTRSPSGKPWLFKGLIILFLLLPVQVSADGPVDLSLGNTGAFPWSVSGIVPGSSGSTFIELHNNGTVGGTLYIWVDNIRETDPHGSGTALGNYMYFNVSHPRLSTSVPLPAHIYAFPSAPMRADYITVYPFPAGQTIKLNWTWEFRETGAPQNDAQEATLRFNISYMLVNVPPPTPTPTPPTTFPTPLPPPPPYIGGGGGDGGGGHRIYTFTGPGGPEETRLPGQPDLCNVTQNYTAGFEGLLYNADGNSTLDLDISKARALGASVTIDTDLIDVYQHNPAGVLFRFWLDTSDIRNTTRIVKHVNKAELWTDTLVANFTTGTFSGSLHAIPDRIIPPSAINITISRCIPSEVIEKIRNVSAQNNLEPESIPYMMGVTWINLPETSAADVTMTLPASWIEKLGGSDLVHIAGISRETGTTELLSTMVVGRDLSGTGFFGGNSPHGSSLFPLFSARQNAAPQQEQVQQPENKESNFMLIAAILIIVIIALAILLLLFAQRRKKKS